MLTITLRRPFNFDKWVNKRVGQLSENRINILKNIDINNKVSKKDWKVLFAYPLQSLIKKNIDLIRKLELLALEGGAKMWVEKTSFMGVLIISIRAIQDLNATVGLFSDDQKY